jgi:hypothetical protein
MRTGTNHTSCRIHNAGYDRIKNVTQEAGCILSTDFKSAHDILDCGYLLQVLEHHKLGDGFINYVRYILHGGTSQLQINGHISSFPIQRSVRQDCPLSMILYI